MIYLIVTVFIAIMLGGILLQEIRKSDLVDDDGFHRNSKNENIKD